MIQVGKSIPLGVQKILLVTDYAHTVGGIETHVQEIRSTLTKMGYITEIYAPLVGKERVIRYLGLLLSFCNIFAYWSLKQKIQKFSPDLIWCHSVARVIGPVGLQAVHTNGALCYKTYHDLGYFSPFATNATSEKTFLSQRYTLQEFLSESRWWQWPYVILKYFKLSWIFKILGRFDLHIIPSAFLEESLARVLPPESRIIVLPHTHAL